MAELLASFGLVEHLWGRTFVPPAGRRALPAGLVAGAAAVPDRRRSPRGGRVHRPRLGALLRHDRSAGAGRRSALRDAARPHRAARGAVRARRRAPRRRHHRGLVRALHRGGDPGGAVQPRRRPVRRSALPSRSGCSRRSTIRRRADCCSARRRSPSTACARRTRARRPELGADTDARVRRAAADRRADQQAGQ